MAASTPGAVVRIGTRLREKLPPRCRAKRGVRRDGENASLEPRSENRHVCGTLRAGSTRAAVSGDVRRRGPGRSRGRSGPSASPRRPVSTPSKTGPCLPGLVPVKRMASVEPSALASPNFPPSRHATPYSPTTVIEGRERFIPVHFPYACLLFMLHNQRRPQAATEHAPNQHRSLRDRRHCDGSAQLPFLLSRSSLTTAPARQGRAAWPSSPISLPLLLSSGHREEPWMSGAGRLGAATVDNHEERGLPARSLSARMPIGRARQQNAQASTTNGASAIPPSESSYHLRWRRVCAGASAPGTQSVARDEDNGSSSIKTTTPVAPGRSLMRKIPRRGWRQITRTRERARLLGLSGLKRSPRPSRVDFSYAARAGGCPLRRLTSPSTTERDRDEVRRASARSAAARARSSPSPTAETRPARRAPARFHAQPPKQREAQAASERSSLVPTLVFVRAPSPCSAFAVFRGTGADVFPGFPPVPLAAGPRLRPGFTACHRPAPPTLPQTPHQPDGR